MQGIKDDRFCATLTIYLTVGCFMQLNTSMEITGKRFFSDKTIWSLVFVILLDTLVISCHANVAQLYKFLLTE